MMTEEELSGMTGNERLFAAGLTEAFASAVAGRDLARVRAILESLYFDGPAIAFTLKNVRIHGTAHDPTMEIEFRRLPR